MANITLSALVKNYGKLRVVHGIDLEIEHNEFIVLLGPSGCGKSTTLRMIAGLEDITSGEIKIADTLVNDLPPRKRNVSMVFQNYALYPHMSVRDNLGFALKIAGQSVSMIDERVNEAADILGLSELMNRIPAELSGGQRQRVAMGRAIVRHPQVFLFDEPLSNLDAKLRGKMRTEIKKLHQNVKTTVVYVTHDQVEAMTLADRIVVMKDGRIEQIGIPMDVFNHPVNTFIASFIGSPPMNQIPAQIKDGKITFADNSTLPLPAKMLNKAKEGQEVIFGFRPEDITPQGHGLIDRGHVASIDLEVKLVEPLGTETILYIEFAGMEVQAKMFNPREITLGEVLTFNLSMDKTHLFDAKTTNSIENN